MGLRRAPAVAPAIGLSIGVAAGFAADTPSVMLAGGLLAGGLALGRRAGGLIAATALGLLAIWGRPATRPQAPSEIEPGRPVTAVGCLTTGWRGTEFGWRSRLRTSHLRQGHRVVPWAWTLDVTVAGSSRPRAERCLRVKGLLRLPPPLANGRHRPPRWTLRIKSVLLTAATSPDPWLWRLAGRLRTLIDDGLGRLAERGTAAAFGALLLGEPERLGLEVRQALRRSGLAHLFAVSGLHIALVVTGAVRALCLLPRRLRLSLAFLLVALYVALVGPRPSVLRAALMAMIAALAVASGRPSDPLQVVALTVASLLLARPELILDLGFQLTVSATAGILLLAPPLRRRWSRLPPVLATGLAASVAAQLGCAPFAWSRFGFLTPLAPGLNLIAVPWASLVLAAAMLWSGVNLLSSRAADLLEPLCDRLVEPLNLLVDLPPSGVLTWPTDLSLPMAAVAAMGAVGALLLRRLAVRLGSLAVLVALLSSPGRQPGGELTMIDVGQGDSFLLRDRGRSVLIDGGGWIGADIAASVLIPALASRGVRRLDGIVVTHGDVDHCRGLLDLSRYLQIGYLRSAPDGLDGRCLTALRRVPWIEWVPVVAGHRWSLGRWRISVLHPPPGSTARGNDRSLVLAVRGFRRRLLLTGDIEHAAEIELLRRTASRRLSCDILKLAHHGSRTSTGSRFLEAVSPRLALVSAGRGNPYGHPSRAVLRRLERAGVRLLRTDRDGMVILRFGDDGSLRLSTLGP